MWFRNTACSKRPRVTLFCNCRLSLVVTRTRAAGQVSCSSMSSVSIGEYVLKRSFVSTSEDGELHEEGQAWGDGAATRSSRQILAFPEALAMSQIRLRLRGILGRRTRRGRDVEVTSFRSNQRVFFSTTVLLGLQRYPWTRESKAIGA